MRFKSIATRIIITIVPLVALFTFVYVVMIYQTMNEQVENEFNERMVESLVSAELSMGIELARNADIAKSLANYASGSSKGTIERGEMETFLMQQVEHNENTVGAGIWYEPHSLYADQNEFSAYAYIEDEEVIYVPDYFESVNYHAKEWYLNGQYSDGQIVWSNVYYDPVAGVTMITASVSFHDQAGDFLGVATADMALTNVKEIVSAISVGKTGRAFLVGSNGEYISFYDQTRTLTRTSTTFITDDEEGELAILGQNVLAKESGFSSVNWNDREYRAYFSKLKETNWHLIIMIETSEVGASAHAQILTLSIVPVMGLVLVSLAIIQVTRRLKRVVNKVNHFADKAASGDLHERIDITETDEFGLMEERLNKMMDDMAEMNERLEKMLLVAQEANKAKTQFLSNMSHEMRTPMNAIIGMVQVAEQTEDREKTKDCLVKINLASKSLLELVNNILDMAKIEANKIEPDIIRTSIRGVFDSISNIYWVKANEKNISFDMTVDDAVPDAIWTDQFRYSQVITNLLSNAIKFTPEGGSVSIAAEIAEETEETVTIKTVVQDTGIGVAPEVADRLFLSFEQADSSTSRRYGGTGLGLAISKSLTELLGGRIWFEPAEEGGSRFQFTIVADKTGEGSHEPEEPLPEAEEYDFSGKFILLVEDVEINQQIVEALLEDTGVTLDFADNGIQACEIYAANPQKYDLIFMDIQMPEMDGLTATRKIREMEKGYRTPIVAMSANAFKEDRDASMEAGMDDHLPKPVDREKMLAVIHQMVS